jgi:hypothetical protein
VKKLDMDWAKSQLEQARVSPEAGISIVKLLEFWSTLDHSNQADEKILELFSKLAQSNALIDNSGNEIWEDARPGFLRVGDEVRVKFNAFENELGQIHNGRRGRIVGVRYGDIIIKTSDGKEPVLDGSHYSPHNLEKLVAVL